MPSPWIHSCTDLRSPTIRRSLEYHRSQCKWPGCSTSRNGWVLVSMQWRTTADHMPTKLSEVTMARQDCFGKDGQPERYVQHSYQNSNILFSSLLAHVSCLLIHAIKLSIHLSGVCVCSQFIHQEQCF